jgi:tRNA (mo5U34)-methyltransferase
MDAATAQPQAPDAAATRAAVDSVPLWYHTLELPGGLTTPGWFDLRPIVELMPWPDVRGKRCIDVGTYDGFLAFELERRGASEVVATDIADHAFWDWPPRLRAQGPETLARLAGPEKGRGFATAHAALGSRVRKEEINIYEISAERLGRFDVVVCGSLMLHLRDPLRALAALRSVCDGMLLSSEVIRIELPMAASRRALLELDGVSDLVHWCVPNAAGHARMVEASGFTIARPGARYGIPLGAGHPSRDRRPPWTQELGRRLLRMGPGVPHQALLARAS